MIFCPQHNLAVGRMRPERGRRHDISAVTQERPDGQAWDFLVNAQNGIEVPCTAVVQRDSDGVGGATVSDNGSSDNGSSDNGKGGVVVGGVTPAPALGPLAMPAAQAAVLSSDPAAGLAALGFPEGWLLPESAVSIIGMYMCGDAAIAAWERAR